MPVKPSEAEEEYFAKQEVELKRKLAAEHRAKVAQEEREREKALHFMRCPKCGSPLEEIALGGIRVDKCFGCEGIFLDKGELDTIHTGAPGSLHRFVKCLLP